MVIYLPEDFCWWKPCP